MKKILLLSLLLTQPSFAEMMCEDTTDYFAVYEPNTYTCNNGYYLPKNTDGCQPCRYGYTCSGGNYAFDESVDQGIQIGVYTCAVGYFLPANAVACQTCPNGFTCSGGTFDFNPDEFQGAVMNAISSTTINNVCADNFPTDLYAIYEPNTIDITYYSDGIEYSSGTCTYDGVLDLPEIPTRPGYIFNGWRVVSGD